MNRFTQMISHKIEIDRSNEKIGETTVHRLYECYDMGMKLKCKDVTRQGQRALVLDVMMT